MSSMAEPQKKTHQKTHKTSRFLACFGFSVKKNPPEKPIQTGSKNTPSLSFPMLCFRPGKSQTKTVPVDNSDKTGTGGGNHTPSKLSKKKSDIKLIPSRQKSKVDRQLSFPNQASSTRPKEVKHKKKKLNLALITSVARKKAIHVVSYNFLSPFLFLLFCRDLDRIFSSGIGNFRTRQEPLQACQVHRQSSPKSTRKHSPSYPTRFR